MTQSATGPLVCTLGLILPFTASTLNPTLPLQLLSVCSKPGFWHKKSSFPKPNITHTL